MEMCGLLFKGLLKNNYVSLSYLQYQGLKSWTGGKKYPGFTYYPRFPDKEDPSYEPSKLLMLQRIKPFKGNDYRLKRILVDLKLDGPLSNIAIVKNTPDVASRLYKIKHLIKITPIRTPDGIPDDGDVNAGYLKEDGEFVIRKHLQADESRLNASEEFLTRPNRLDSDTLIKQSRDKWMNPYH